MRIALSLVFVFATACGGNSPPPAEPAHAPAASTEPSAVPAAQPRLQPEPAREAERAPEPAPPPKKSIYERLRDTDGKIAGLPGYAIQRIPDKNFCGGTAIITTHAKKVAKEDQPIAAIFNLEFPTGLSFDPDPKNAKKKEASQKKFDAFMKELQKVGADARKHYDDQLWGTGDAKSKAVALARIVQLVTRTASMLSRLEIPADVRSGEFAEENIATFCDQFLVPAERLQDQAEQAIAICVEHAKSVASGWWNEVCVAP